MIRNLIKVIILLGFISVLSSCLSPTKEVKTVFTPDNNDQQDNKQLIEGNTADYKLPIQMGQKQTIEKLRGSMQN